MLDKDSLTILDFFRKNTIEVKKVDEDIEEKPIQKSSENISPDLSNVGALNRWTSS